MLAYMLPFASCLCHINCILPSFFLFLCWSVPSLEIYAQIGSMITRFVDHFYKTFLCNLRSLNINLKQDNRSRSFPLPVSSSA